MSRQARLLLEPTSVPANRRLASLADQDAQGLQPDDRDQRREVDPAEDRQHLPQRPQQRLAERGEQGVRGAARAGRDEGQSGVDEDQDGVEQQRRQRERPQRRHGERDERITDAGPERNRISVAANCTTSSATSEAVSKRPTGGSTRRSGMTSQLVSVSDRLGQRIPEVGAQSCSSTRSRNA